jgi:glucokinase
MILAADFGGTTIKLGLVNDSRIVTRARLDVEPSRPMSDQLEAVAGLWEQLLRDEGASLKDCQGIALGLPFFADLKEPRVRGEFGKFPGAAEIDYGAWSRQRLGLPVALENDLRLAVLGEWAAGAARGKSEVVMLAFGTGVGCAAISGGRLFRGAHNRAGTLLGHATVASEPAISRCGNIGCAEDLASTATLETRARGRADFANSALSRAEKINFELLFALAVKGDACAQALLDESLTVWAIVVQNAVLAYDPEVVVLGGGVLRSREVVLPFIQEHLRRHMPGLPLEVPVLAAELGDDAALLGGAVYFQSSRVPS